MRIKSEIRTFIKENTQKICPGAKVYLFGSRLHDELSGGDIDILILSDEQIEKKRIRSFRREFFKQFGWQKIDLVNFTHKEETTFKKLISKEAQLL